MTASKTINNSVIYSGIKTIGIAPFFPTPYRPELGIFIYSLFEEMRKQGIHLNVIATLPWTQRYLDPLFRKNVQSGWIEESKILRPYYSNLALHLSSGTRWAYQRTLKNLQRAIQRSFTKIPADWVYAHFFTTGLACLDICYRRKITCIVCLGESSLENVSYLVGLDAFCNALDRFTGVIVVSRENERFCRERCPSLCERLVYIPNGVDTAKFYPRNREEIRKKLGLPSQLSIALFCGHFIKRKGPLRVQEALELLPDIYGIFLGQGRQVPYGPRVLHAGVVPHEWAPLWFAAADVFVLPSLAEGMSNAILEALASGLPVVVSDRIFNREFLSTDCAVFVDPISPASIAEGIEYVLANPYRKIEMSRAAVSLSAYYTLSSRVNKIFEFYHYLKK